MSYYPDSIKWDIDTTNTTDTPDDIKYTTSSTKPPLKVDYINIKKVDEAERRKVADKLNKKANPETEPDTKTININKDVSHKHHCKCGRHLNMDAVKQCKQIHLHADSITINLTDCTVYINGNTEYSNS